jgi:hypothetical protein
MESRRADASLRAIRGIHDPERVFAGTAVPVSESPFALYYTIRPRKYYLEWVVFRSHDHSLAFYCRTRVRATLPWVLRLLQWLGWLDPCYAGFSMASGL